MKNGIGIFGPVIQQLHGFFRWEDDQFNVAPSSLTSYFIHDWQCPAARADHQPSASSRYLFLPRERRVPETVPKLLGRFLFALANLAMVDYYVITVFNPINPNFPE